MEVQPTLFNGTPVEVVMTVSVQFSLSIRRRTGEATSAIGDDDPGQPRWLKRVMSTLLIVVVVIILLGVVPAWPHSRNWGYGPSGGLGLVLLILLVLLLTGRL